MSDTDFPLQGTKISGLEQQFDLTNPVDRYQYFQAKVGKEIEKIKTFMETGTFIGFLLGIKNAGKGTYSKMFAELVGQDRYAHIAFGDVVRKVEQEYANPDKRQQIVKYMQKKYRGYLPLQDALKTFENRDNKFLLPTEFILCLVEREIDQISKKTLFIDGFPRDLDQISYSLYFRDLINYRDDPDFFIILNVPEAVINERIKHRRVCPKCQTSRNIKLLATSDIRYDHAERDFYLWCDNPECGGARMVAKEGDDKGIENFRERIDKDKKLIEMAYQLHGVPKIFLRNSIPVDFADKNFDPYELTPEFYYEIKGDRVVTKTKPWIIKDDHGVDSYSLMPAAVVVSLIRQLVEVLGL
jgi:adenylate kinase family enzyme